MRFSILRLLITVAIVAVSGALFAIFWAWPPVLQVVLAVVACVFLCALVCTIAYIMAGEIESAVRGKKE